MDTRTLIGTGLTLALAACTSGGSNPSESTITITHSNVNVVTVPVTTTVVNTNVVNVPDPKIALCDAGTPGLICTYAGIPHIAQFSPESLDRRASALYLPIDIAFNPADGQLYIIDFNNHRIRTVLADNTVVTVAGTGFLGDGIFNDATQLWEDGPALQFAFNHPGNITFDPVDSYYMYIGAWHNSRVERLNFADDSIEFFAGTGGRGYGSGASVDTNGDGVLDGAPFLATKAIFNLTPSVTFDDDENLYVADQANLIIRKIPPDGTISNIAGTQGQYGYTGDGGDATLAKLANNVGQFADPQGRAVFHEGSLYIADTENQVVRRLNLTTNEITTVAGKYVSTGINGLDTDGDGDFDLVYGDPGYGGDGGQATNASLNKPHDIAFGPDGTMYIADFGNHCIRSVDTSGVIDTFAGQCGDRPDDFTLDLGDAGDPLLATFNHPSGVEVDDQGNVFVADQDDHVIRVIWK